MPFSPSAPACDPCWSIKAPVQFSLTRPSDVTTVDGTTRIVDGVSYFQITDTSYDIGGQSDVLELHPDGARQRFHLTGFLLNLARIR